MSDATVRLEVLRSGSGEVDDGGSRRDVFDVPYDDRTSVLDALQWVKDHADPTLTFRWSCKMAVCGSCGVMVNGRPVLGCETFVRGYRTTGLVVEPLAHAEVLRDLVVDTDTFLGKLAEVQPWLVPDAATSLPLAGAAPTSGHRQTPGELAAYRDFAECIDCMLCYSACPQLDAAPDFLGPAVVATARRWDTDSRDTGELARADVLDTEFGAWPCIQVGACTQVCPKGVDPARALRDAQRVATETWGERERRRTP
ncbi:4Fe-4S dicluster domain-containing protein [Cellulosimicrobium terreum]|nr:4Fe-4S dicluster domain-containing protein [Cellulosimicrobium terreum]